MTDTPEQIACEAHDWEATRWGVIIGVSRCKKCRKLSTEADFPAVVAERSNADG